MKVKEMKEFLNRVDDDFEITISLIDEIPEIILKDSAYPYPYNYLKTNFEFDDISYSEKNINFSVEPKETTIYGIYNDK